MIASLTFYVCVYFSNCTERKLVWQWTLQGWTAMYQRTGTGTSLRVSTL